MQIDLANMPTDTTALQALVRVLAGDVKNKGLLIEQLKGNRPVSAPISWFAVLILGRRFFSGAFALPA